MLDMIRKISIIGKPNEAYSLKVIFVNLPLFLSLDIDKSVRSTASFLMNLSTKLAVTPPAVAQMRVPLETAQTPSESDHQ